MQKKGRFSSKFFASLLSVLTAFSPAVSVIPVYAENDNDTTNGIDITNTDSGISVTEADTHTLSIDVDGFSGELIVNEGEEDEQTVRISESDDEDVKKASVTDADGHVTEAEVNSENPYAIVLTKEAGTVVTVQAKADAGFEVAQYSILMDSGAEEETDFKTDTYSAFMCEVTIDADKVMEVGFEKADDGVVLSSNIDGISVETEDDIKVETETSEIDDDISIEKEENTETETNDDDQIVIESETPADRFVSVYLGDNAATDDLNASDFASMRLVVLTDDESVIANEGDIIGHYDNFYLLEFTSIQQTMNAYVYYKDKVSAVEPDKVVEVATETEDDGISLVSDTPIAMDETVNPISALNDVEESVDSKKVDNVIALIDTGASEYTNVIDRVSVIDDVLTGSHSHADAMVDAIVSQNPDAKILSIRAMNDNGFGTISSLVAGMEYAIENKVSIINLSLYSKTTLTTSVLKQEIIKATEAGIIVVGAAGNDGVDVADYMPGSVEEAVIIGAAKADGSRLSTSNFGSTVDYNVVAKSTSEAAAMFTGFISLNGLDAVADVLNQGMIYATDYVFDGDIVVDPEEPAEDDWSKYTLDTSKVAVARYSLAYADLLNDGDTIDSIYRNDEHFDKLITTVDTVPDVYAVGDGTYKFKMDAPMINKYVVGGQYPDVIFANGNNNGEVITEGVSFNKETGVVTVTEEAMQKADGDFANIQCQVLVPVNGIPDDIMQTITIINSDGTTDETKLPVYGLIQESVPLSIEGVDEDLTSDDFEVYVNGEQTTVPVEWDADNHCLNLITETSALVYSVKVVVKKNTDSVFKVAVPNPGNSTAYRGLTPTFYLKDGTDVNGLYAGLATTGTCIVGAPGYPAWPVNGPTINGEVAAYPGYDCGGTLGWVGFPTSLFGVNFQFYNKSGSSLGNWEGYNAGLRSPCVHISSGASPARHMSFQFKILDSWTSGDYKYFAMSYVSALVFASGATPQNFGGVLVFAVKDALAPFSVVKSPLEVEACTNLIYKHGNKSEGLLNAYADLTTTFDVYSVKYDGKTPYKRLGTIQTDTTGKVNINKNTYPAILKQMKLNDTYLLVETKAPKNYLNAHSLTNDANIREDWFTGPVTFKYTKDAVVSVTDPVAYDPNQIFIAKKAEGVADVGGPWDLSGARYRLDYYQENVDGTYETDVTYSWELKPRVVTFSSGVSVYLISLTNPDCYVDKSSIEFLLTDIGSVCAPIGKYVLTEIKAPVGFKLQPSVTGTISYSNGTNEYNGAPVFKWLDKGTGAVIEGMDPTDEYIVTNEPQNKFGIHIDKTSGGISQLVSGTSLSGVTFGVFNENDYTVTVNGKNYNKGEEIACVCMTIDGSEADGWEAKTDAVLPAGTYSVRELSGNEFYPMSDDTVTTVTFPVDTPDKTIKHVQFEGEDYTYDNEVVHGGTILQKTDYMLGISNDHGNTDLSGAEFAVVASGEAGSFVEKADGSHIATTPLGERPTYEQVSAAIDKSRVMTLITDKNGNAITGADALSFGTYYIIETVPAEGYSLNTSYVGKVVITKAGMIVKPENVGSDAADVEQMIYTGGLKVQKLDYMRDADKLHGDAHLAGAEFTIVNASKTIAVNYEDKEIQSTGLSGTNVTYAQVAAYAKQSKYVMDVITTDESGAAKTHVHTCDTFAKNKEGLPYGTYYVIETKAPAGFLLNEEWVGMVTVTADGVVYEPTVIAGNDYHRDSNHATVGVPAGDKYGTRDQIYRGGISLNKIDTEMNDATAQGMGTLKGAEFKIINVSEGVVRNSVDADVKTAKSKVSSNPTWSELAKLSDEYVVQTITTNIDGRATTGTKTLPYGTYYVIESKSSNGYFINDGFVGKVVIRDDNVMLELGAKATKNGSYFVDMNNNSATTVREQIRRGDLSLLKVNIDGEYKQYIPFLISAIRVNDDGSETVIESHVIVCDEYGRIQTARKHSNNTNGMDKYLVGNSKISAEGEKYLKEAATWGVWFQGSATNYPKDAVNDDFGALYDGYYRITELQCEDNKGLEENLLNTELIRVTNDTVDYYTPMKPYENIDNFHDLVSTYGLIAGNARPYIYHPLVDTEIVMTSEALDVESETQTVPVRESVVVSDTVTFTHVSSDHKYRLETKFVDLTTGETLKILGTDDENAAVSEDGAWVTKVFQPAKQSGTNNTYGSQSVTARINTTGLEGHVIMAYDYLYEYIDISDNDAVKGDWVLVKRHPADGEEDDAQKLYVPSIHTNAVDKLTGDRVGAKSKDDAVIDTVSYMNLYKGEDYVLTMTVVDTKTGQPLYTNEDGSAKVVTSPITFRRVETPVSGKVTMPEFKLDSSKFKDGMSVTVVETLYRADEDGSPLGEPLLVHDSILDEDQTIRWIDVGTSASDKNTKDDVGTDEDVATVYDNVTLNNVIFDDNDHDGQYEYKVKGHLVYQKDFTDANGKKHKAGDTVETLDGTQNEVLITSDAAGNVSFTYADGTVAEGKIVKSAYGHNVAKSVDKNREGDNSYIVDNTAMYCDLMVELQFKVNSNDLAGGTVVVFEDLYHDSTGEDTDVIVASHSDITDKGQTVHYPDVHTSAVDNKTKDDVGARIEHERVVDTVTLTNLVPGRHYVVNGVLMNQLTGEKMKVNGKDITQSASIYVTDDGQIVAGNGERVIVTKYDAELNEVSGTIDLTFEFDARLLAGETVVVFEDLIHNGITVATHSDIKDESQTVHFPEVHTTAIDAYTKDEVGTVAEKAEIIDTVAYKNLVPGRVYTLTGTLMNQKTGEVYKDADGKEVTVSRTFTAGTKENGIVVDVDSEHNSVSGTVEMKFSFNGTNLEDTTLVVFEDLYHNNIKVTAHNDIKDKSQTVHFPKVRTSAIDTTTGDEVGVVGETTIRDVVNFWNLVPGKDYTIKGVIYDKTTGEFLTDADGKQIEAENPFHVNDDGTVDNCCTLPCHCKGGTCTCEDWSVCISDIDKEHNDSDGHASLIFKVDATELAGHDLVLFEYLYHNDVVVAKHEDVNDLGQTIHFANLGTSAVDIKTNDTTGTVEKTAIVKDTVYYENLVVGREYTIKGVLMNQYTGAPVVNEDGTLATAEATFTATEKSSDVNIVDDYDEKDNSVDGAYILTFTVDSTSLAGKTVVAYETLYHNNVKIIAHTDLFDKAQSVHYPDIHTTAVDSNTGDHVGSIWGALINGVRHLFGETDADGNGIADDVQQNIIDTVTLNNLVPGYTYVVSGKLYDVDKSHEANEPVPVTIDGKEIVQAVTITVAEDGKSIKAANGVETTVTNYDKEKNSVDGTVALVYTLDSSKVQDTKLVVFEDLYHDSTYTPDMSPWDVKPEDIVHTHSDIDDEGQSISEIGIHTTAIDTKTQNHVGVIPAEDEYSVIRDEVNMTKLVPDMSYTVKGVLVDINESDLENGKVMYLAVDGTLTDKREEAYEETLTFTAAETEEIHYLNFALTSDKVQGRALTVFEDIYHNDVKITSHPALEAIDKWDEVSFQNQTVYYPTGKTNATDNVTGTHTSYAAGTRVVTDRVYFENLIVGENYEIDGQLVYQSDFTDVDGNVHKAGDALDGAKAAVKFTASADMTEVSYVDSDDKAAIDSLKVTKLPNGQTVVSGYVSLEFEVDASKLAGATLVAFEEFKNNDVTIFTHANLNDLPQTIRIPEIHTNASVEDLDEASIRDENGEYKDVTIVDTVTFKNVWTQAELDAMYTQGLAIEYADGTYRVEKSDIYDINEKATYVMKGVLMNKDTGEPLTNADGGTYTVFSEPFSPESNNGTVNVEFVVNAGDFIKDGSDESELEGLTVVAFEDMYQVTDKDDASDATLIATHADIDDVEQDIRFPKARTHAADGISSDVEMKDGQMLAFEDVESLLALHENEKTTTNHEVFATTDISITDLVSVENLHGGTKYTVTGTLQVITEYDEDGNSKAYEAAVDDNGNVITSTVEFDTTALSADYNDSVSGYVPVTFTFSGVNLAGKTTVAFETVSRDGVTLAVHADIQDAMQTVYMPAIHTNASDALTGLNETLAGSQTVILDKVTYENLEYGKTYSLAGTLHKKSDGNAVEGSTVSGTFVAGVDNQFIMADGTKVMTLDELRAQYGTTATQTDWSSATSGNTNVGTNSGDGELDITEKTEYVVGKDIPAGYYKITPVDNDGTGLFGYWCIYYSEDGSVPTERKLSNTLTNGIVSTSNPVNYIRLADNMVLQISNSVINGKANSEFVQVSESEALPQLDYTVATYFKKLDNGTVSSVMDMTNDVSTETPVNGDAGTDVNETTDKPDAVNTEKGDMTKRVSGEVYVVTVLNSEQYAGDTLVAFESLSAFDDEGNGKVIAVHEDIEDVDQSVALPKIQTSATIDGGKTAAASTASKVVDTVSYQNLTPGRTYQMVGTLMDKTTGKSTGVTAVQEFTPDKADGVVEIIFTIDTTSLVGRQLVVFEELITKSEDGKAYVVAQHKDITDAAQTVTVTQPPEDKVTPNIDTSDMAHIGYLIGVISMVLLLAGLTILRKKKYRA